MLEFGFSNMRFEQNELSNLDVFSNLEIFNGEDNLQWREMIAPNHFPLFDLDYEKFNKQIYKSEINEVDASLSKKDEWIQTELPFHDDNDDIFKKNEAKTPNKECVKIEEKKEHSTSLWASGDNITNVQFENPENLISKVNDSDINDDINSHNPKESLEYLKELVDKKKFKKADKQRRFGRNDDRGKI